MLTPVLADVFDCVHFGQVDQEDVIGRTHPFVLVTTGSNPKRHVATPAIVDAARYVFSVLAVGNEAGKIVESTVGYYAVLVTTGIALMLLEFVNIHSGPYYCIVRNPIPGAARLDLSAENPGALNDHLPVLSVRNRLRPPSLV